MLRSDAELNEKLMSLAQGKADAQATPALFFALLADPEHAPKARASFTCSFILLPFRLDIRMLGLDPEISLRCAWPLTASSTSREVEQADLRRPKNGLPRLYSEESLTVSGYLVGRTSGSEHGRRHPPRERAPPSPGAHSLPPSAAVPRGLQTLPRYPFQDLVC